jgi:hypothetical protein
MTSVDLRQQAVEALALRLGAPPSKGATADEVLREAVDTVEPFIRALVIQEVVDRIREFGPAREIVGRDASGGAVYGRSASAHVADLIEREFGGTDAAA